MKKSMKFIIVIGIVFILIGGVFCGAAYAFGERYVEAKLENSSNLFSSEDISNITVNESVAEIKFIRNNSGKNEISVEAENISTEDFKCEISGDTLKISYNPSPVKFGFISLPSFMFNMNSTSPVINVYIPEDKVFGKVYFESGVGNVNIEEINTDSFVIGGGVGNYDIRNMITRSLKINGGVGEVNISGIISGNTHIDSGVGNTRISGQADGDITIKGGVGNISLDLTGNTDDYNYNINGGLGNISLNGNKISESNRITEGKYNIDIDGGVGNVNINIKNK